MAIQPKAAWKRERESEEERNWRGETFDEYLARRKSERLAWGIWRAMGAIRDVASYQQWCRRKEERKNERT